MIGLVFGKLTVREFAFSDGNAQHWRCDCSCGGEVVARTSDLRSGHTSTCGCARRENFKNKGKHLHSKRGATTPEYRAWCHMRRRCTEERNRSYRYYGGRGIKVCTRWLDSFEAFLEDMGPRPSDRHSLDRINVDGDYEPGNCRWATRTEQNRNRRGLRMISVGGSAICASEARERAGIAESTFYQRLRKGWSEEEALLVRPDKSGRTTRKYTIRPLPRRSKDRAALASVKGEQA